MSITIAPIISDFDSYIGDTSNDRVTAAQRLQFISEATVWLQEELKNDHTIKTYTLPYYDGIHYYKVTTSLASLLEGADLRRGEEDQTYSFAHKSSRELAEEIGQGATESSWAIEQRNGDSFLVVNHMSKYQKTQVCSFDSLTADGGTWAADTTNSDATNVTADSNEYVQGTGSLNFDITVAQSGNNRATVSSTIGTKDLSDFEDLGTWIFRVYIPDVTYTSSVTFYWGNSSTSYWSSTATTNSDGGALVSGWNRIAIAWSGATATSSPTAVDVDYIRFDVNYGASQGDDTDYRIDDLSIVRPENLTFHYASFVLGTDTTGAVNKTVFTATTDIPFFSGQYDNYRYAVAHKAASLAFYGPLRNDKDGQSHLAEASLAIRRQRNIFPSSITKELKSFKVHGLNFRRRR